MKKRIFAGFLLAFMLMFTVIPCFAEPVAETEAEAVAEAPAEGEEAPAEEAPVEEAPAPQLPQFKHSKNFTLKEAFYNHAEKTISLILANNTDDQQGIPYLALDFDSAKIDIAADFQNILDESIAPQAGIEMQDGVIIMVQKMVEPGKEQVIKFNATVNDYKEGEIPDMKLRVFVQTVSTVLDLTTAGAAQGNDLTIQQFDNILATGAAKFSVIDFAKANPVVAIVIIALIIVLCILIVNSVKRSKKNVEPEVSEETENDDNFVISDEFEEFEADMNQEYTEDEEEGDSENEEL